MDAAEAREPGFLDPPHRAPRRQTHPTKRLAPSPLPSLSIDRPSTRQALANRLHQGRRAAQYTRPQVLADGIGAPGVARPQPLHGLPTPCLYAFPSDARLVVSVLQSKYGVPERDAVEMSGFLSPMLDFSPTRCPPTPTPGPTIAVLHLVPTRTVLRLSSPSPWSCPSP